MLIEQGGPHDGPFLLAMFLEAAWQTPMSCGEVMTHPELGRYVKDWGRPGDTALIAREDAGAAWYRLFTAADHGYGFVDEGTPELGIAVVQDRRREGIGRALLTALLVEARAAGFRALSLSVSRQNVSARKLYEELGFVPVEDVDGSTTMMVPLIE